jgi:hypothetical protein
MRHPRLDARGLNARANTDVFPEANMTSPSDRDRPESLDRERAEAVKEVFERKEASSDAVDRAADALEGAVQGRVPDGDLVGRTVQTTVYARNGGAIAQVGDIITEDQIERARSEGVLRDLLEATTTASEL